MAGLAWQVGTPLEILPKYVCAVTGCASGDDVRRHILVLRIFVPNVPG